jgi:hypothetical protein
MEPHKTFAQKVQDVADAITAPFENQILCLGLIEVAKGVIIEQGKKPQSPIVKPHMEIKLPNG